MFRRGLSICAVSLGLAAMLGLAALLNGTPEASAAGPPARSDCGDMAGPVWRVFIPNEKKGSTGSHYSVYAVNIPCASARSLAARVMRKHSPGPGPSTSLFPGYTCLITNVPNGMLLFAGGCVRGKFAHPMPVPDAKSFEWAPCYSTVGNATHKPGHPSCKWRPAYQTV